MVAITDKFGKASISTGYATATTVKTARTPGVVVLETFDLSDFAPDTPVFFVTYKKTTDPVTNAVTITSQTSWKALVNPDNNTLTNLSLAPGYTDIGNEVGDFVECIPTSFWGNSLIEGLFVSINPDGTLKTSAVNAALGITGVTPADWNVLPATPTVASSNGQREHVIRYSGVNYTTTLQPGTKLRVPRTGTTPTTSMGFVAASSQFASKATPTGITFTDDFTCEAWIYLDSYDTSASTILAREDATGANGFQFDIDASGRIRLIGKNGGAGNLRYTQSYQSIPLNKWTHIAATLDMSGWTTATNKIYLDGVDVPLEFKSVGTNPTSLVNTGDFAIGRPGLVANSYINGKLANARVWSTIRTAAQIRDNMNQEVPASTTGLVAHFKGNGSWNDSSTNANHLTASGGAVNNFASHPYSAVEYAIATKIAYTGGNTDVTIFTGSGCLPNETLGATSYSTAGAPFGFPADKNKWKVQLHTQGWQTANNAGLVWLNHEIAVPTGAWTLGYDVHISQATSAAAVHNSQYSLSTTKAGTIDVNSPLTTAGTIVNIVEFYPELNANDSVTLAAMATYYFNCRAVGANFTTQGLRNGMRSVIYAACAYYV
jgi:hypothetical protein